MLEPPVKMEIHGILYVQITELYCIVFQQSSVNFLYHTCQTMTVKNVQIVWEKPQMFLKQ